MTTNLERQLEGIRQRLAGRRGELEPVIKRLDALPGEMVDATDEGDRLACFAEYTELQQGRDMLLLEIAELTKREKLAHIALFADKENRARRAHEKAQSESAKLRREAQELSDTLRAAQSGRIPENLRGNQDEIALYKADLRGKSARAWALSANAGRAKSRALDAWNAAKAELKQVREL